MLQWPGLWVQCYTYFSGTSTPHPVTDGAFLDAFGRVFWLFLFVCPHSWQQNDMALLFSSSEWWMYDIWSLELLEICCESDLMLNDAVIGNTCLLVHRYLRIGELSTLQQSNIARSINGIWPLGTLWGFLNWDSCTKKRFAGVDCRLQAVLSFWLEMKIYCKTFWRGKKGIYKAAGCWGVGCTDM